MGLGVAVGVALGATTAGGSPRARTCRRARIAEHWLIPLGPKNALPRPSATTAATASVVSGHRSGPPRAEPAPLTGSMDLVQDGIGDPVRQGFHALCEVGGEERFGIARLRHASCSWSRTGVRASASSAARMAAVA